MAKKLLVSVLLFLVVVLKIEEKEEYFMRYKVTTCEEEYEVTVEELDEEYPKLSCDTGDDASLTVAQNEYNYCFERSVKLDNKVYILLTVCAFLFVMLSEAIKKLSEFAIPISRCQLYGERGYIALLTMNIAAFVILLFKLIKLLRGIELMRFDSYEILHRDMIRADKKQTIQFVCMVYEKCRNYNNQLIERQYEQFNTSVKLIEANVILLLVLAIYRSLL